MSGFPRPNLLALATATALLTLGVLPVSASTPGGTQSLLQQRLQMPAEFREHLFGTPISVRVELDGVHLGDADVLLDEDNRVQLLGFGDSLDSPLPRHDRERWASQLAEPIALGVQETPARGLKAIHYSLESSLLTLLSVEGAASEQRYITQSTSGSSGLLLRNTLAYSGGRDQESALRYGAELQGSVGLWSTLGNYHYYHSNVASDVDGHYISALHAQREFQDQFLRVGYFLPNFQGVTRQPRTPGTQNDTTLGIMVGSSDALRVDTGGASVYPVYVTAGRDGVVEIYRDGALIATQSVVAGMQELNTRRLPGGIYDVELRVLEDGRVVSQESATIHKPGNWSDPTRRWRYSAFAGQQRGLLDSGGDRGGQDGRLAVGAVVNRLVHPRAVAGLAVQKVGQSRTAGASLDWQVSDRLNFYTNLYDATDAGRGADVLGMYRYAQGSIGVAHARNWVERRQLLPAEEGFPQRWQTDGGWQDSSSVSLSHRFSNRDSANIRLAHNRGFNEGLSFDASWSRRQTLFGAEASWRLSVYDRPPMSYVGAGRQRGIDFTLNLALGDDRRRYSGSVGSAARLDRHRDVYASASVHQQVDAEWLQSIQGTVTADRSGLGVGAAASFDQQQLQGDAQVMRTAEGSTAGSVNLESTLALGGGAAALLGRSQAANATTGMIVDVRSDYPGLQLRADDSSSGGVVLKAGRNFVPVTAYKPGHINFDFEGNGAPAAMIQPATLSYQLNKGGVQHASVDVVRTFTVMGQIVGPDGTGVRGVHAVNHVGRSVSQDEGFFTLQLSAREPAIELQFPDNTHCDITLDEGRFPREGDVLMVGALQCPADAAPR